MWNFSGEQIYFYTNAIVRYNILYEHRRMGIKSSTGVSVFDPR